MATNSSKPYLAKGSNVSRCKGCLMSGQYCICDAKCPTELAEGSSLEIWLLMHKEETYKPTNTGRLIEDILPASSRRFHWHRTSPDPELLSLLKDSRYQPYIIFPGDRGGYEDRVVTSANLSTNKIPVFIILDGSWRQAGRMFRLSQYLQHLPVLPLTARAGSRYKLRKAPDEFHLCTVEVAIELLASHQQQAAAIKLEAYFVHFNEMYARSRREYTKEKL